MPRHRITARARLDAPAALVYAIIADYRQHHPRILPAAFSNFVVRKGGVGAGTEITFDLRVLGIPKHYAGMVSEPDPGRHLVEAYPSEGSETTFTVEPEGSGCTLTIATEFTVRTGLAGALERWLSGRILQPLYADELTRLAAYAATLPGDY